MNSNRSLRSDTNISGRNSPSLPPKKTDSFIKHPSSSSPLPTSNHRLSNLQQQDSTKNESPRKYFDYDDNKFHKTVFERCADLPKKILITNREKFLQALNYVGYDLPKSTVDQIWSKNDQEIDFKSFQRILNEEKEIDERTLEDAFNTLYNKDHKSDWSAIDYNKFRTDMIDKGDRFTDNEFEHLRTLLGTKDGKIDIKKLTKLIGDNKNTCREKILKAEKEEKRDQIERPERVNSPKLNNNIHLILDPPSKKLDIPKTHSLHMKGAFFCEYFDSPTDALYFTIGYSFEIKKNTSVWITIEPKLASKYHPNSTFKNLDIRLLLFRKHPKTPERSLIHMSSDRSGTKTYLHVDELSKGSYEIIPVTFGGVLRPRTREVNERAPIKKLRDTKKGNHFSMSHDYRDALEFVFDQFDFDDNKQLDRHEYNLWTIRTAGEEITNDDWSQIRDHLRLDTDEAISKAKFLELNDFEVQQADTKELELWSGLKSVGFNYALELDMMCPFNLTVHLNEPDVHLKPTSYIELAEIKKILIKFLENKGEKVKLNNPSVHCFNYHDDSGSILFVENKSASNAKISIEITNSNNVAVNLATDTRKPTVINVRRDTSQILWFAHRLNTHGMMELDANIRVQ